MRIGRIFDPVMGTMRVLIIEKDDKPTGLCENCAKPYYNHPELRKSFNQKDWCLDCNDDAFIAQNRMSEYEFALWTASQVAQNHVMLVIRDIDCTK